MVKFYLLPMLRDWLCNTFQVITWVCLLGKLTVEGEQIKLNLVPWETFYKVPVQTMCESAQ